MPEEKIAPEQPQETPLTQIKISPKLMEYTFIGLLTLFALICGIYIGYYYGIQCGLITKSTPQPTQSLTPKPTTGRKSFSLASITLTLGSSESSDLAELLVTDPQGHRTGVDPRTGISYDEIADAFYYIEAYPGYPYKIFDLSSPLDGIYIIEVIGTGSDFYTLDILNYDEVGDPSDKTISGEIEANKVDTYKMDFSSTAGSRVKVSQVQ